MKKIMFLTTIFFLLFIVACSQSKIDYNQDERSIHQQILNEFIECNENKDIDCVCEYLVKWECYELKEYNKFDEFNEAINEFFLEPENSILGEVFEEHSEINRITYGLQKSEKGYIHNVEFIIEDDLWKIYDFD